MRPNEIWHDATPDASVEASSVAAEFLVSEDILFTVAEESVAGGVIDFFCSFYPVSADSSVVAA